LLRKCTAGHSWLTPHKITRSSQHSQECNNPCRRRFCASWPWPFDPENSRWNNILRQVCWSCIGFWDIVRINRQTHKHLKTAPPLLPSASVTRWQAKCWGARRWTKEVMQVVYLRGCSWAGLSAAASERRWRSCPICRTVACELPPHRLSPRLQSFLAQQQTCTGTVSHMNKQILVGWIILWLQRTGGISRGLRAGECIALAMKTEQASGDLHLHGIKHSSTTTICLFYHLLTFIYTEPEEASTQKNAKTHAGTVFVPSDLDLWPFDPERNGFPGVIESLWNISGSSLMILAAAAFEISCGQTNRQMSVKTLPPRLPSARVITLLSL